MSGLLDEIVPWSWHGPEGDPDRIALLDRDDVRELLRSDETVERIARGVWEKNRLLDDGYGPWEEAEAWDKDWGRDSVRAVLAALAGDDQ